MSSLRINEIFTSLQGEGVNSGIPMTFIRLQGCSVGCAWCDTKPSWNPRAGQEMELGSILEQVTQPWVCITGGEPAEAPVEELAELIGLLRGRQIRVCVETSGLGKLMACDHLTLSPKGHKPDPGEEFFTTATEIKVVVVDSGDVSRALRYRDKVRPNLPVFLQPVWGSEESAKICTEACRKHHFRLSLQTHKYLNIR